MFFIPEAIEPSVPTVEGDYRGIGLEYDPAEYRVSKAKVVFWNKQLRTNQGSFNQLKIAIPWYMYVPVMKVLIRKLCGKNASGGRTPRTWYCDN